MVTTKNKRDNPRFADEEDIPLINQDDDDYDDYNAPNASRIDETSFTVPDTTESTSILRLRQKVKRDKIIALYRRLNVAGNPGLIKLDRFVISKKIQKQLALTCFFSMVITIGNPLLIGAPVGFYRQKH